MADDSSESAGSDPEQSELQARAEALQRAKEAAGRGDANGMVEGLHRSYALDGLKRQLEKRWASLPADDVDLVVGRAVDALYAKIAGGKQVGSIVGWLFKAAEKMLFDRHRERKRETLYGGEEEIAHLAEEGRVMLVKPPDGPQLDYGEWIPDEAKKKALALARELLPQLGQINIQRVMGILFDAVEAGESDLPDSEIAQALGLKPGTVAVCKHRGFVRLERLMAERGWRIRILELADPRKSIGQ